MPAKKKTRGRPRLKEPRVVKLAGVRLTQKEHRRFKKASSSDKTLNPDGEFADWVRMLMSRRADALDKKKAQERLR